MCRSSMCLTRKQASASPKLTPSGTPPHPYPSPRGGGEPQLTHECLESPSPLWGGVGVGADPLVLLSKGDRKAATRMFRSHRIVHCTCCSARQVCSGACLSQPHFVDFVPCSCIVGTAFTTRQGNNRRNRQTAAHDIAPRRQRTLTGRTQSYED
jgi:hypothetical protein